MKKHGACNRIKLFLLENCFEVFAFSNKYKCNKNLSTLFFLITSCSCTNNTKAMQTQNNGSVLEMESVLIENTKKRIEECDDRLQLRFPTSYRDGKLLQQLVPLILTNPKITHLAVGLRCNHEQGFNALTKVMTSDRVCIVTLDLRIEDADDEKGSTVCNIEDQTIISLEQLRFFESISTCRSLKHLIIRMDDVNTTFSEILQRTIVHSKSVTELTLKCDRISECAMKAICDAVSQKGNYLFFPYEKSKTNHFFKNLMKQDQQMPIEIFRICVDYLEKSKIKTLAECSVQSKLTHLDITNCRMTPDTMTHLIQHLNMCKTISKIAFGNNGAGTIQAFFSDYSFENLKHLVCCESYSFIIDHICLNIVTKAFKQSKKIEFLQIPMLIFEETSSTAIANFAKTLSLMPNLHTLQFFPLKNVHFLECLFLALTNTSKDSENKQSKLTRLYLESVGCDRELFTEKVSQSFCGFMASPNGQALVELQMGFCRMCDFSPLLLDWAESKCFQLVAATDDILRHNHYNTQLVSSDDDNRNRDSAVLHLQLNAYRKYQNRVHKVCERNLTQAVAPFLSDITCLAKIIAQFVGFDAMPEKL
ncbi:hypothetical protein RFI_03052 [Reticulomyxa filosa]|uniref:Uncharacterized protein n=1 Tax=Reticulomyxa filosa TaxID=46433 RepID=X6P8R3_RETFI|nr:hypothetical protein RFI_03052 [Reticulomyxa filosa]|eukprot:ETO34042.1 hypothetical protein RFI_03052 [Reticulomyxa filosa]